jgi:hypothetical protein
MIKPLWVRVNLPCDALILSNRIGLSTGKTSEKKEFSLAQFLLAIYIKFRTGIIGRDKKTSFKYT